MRNRIPGQKVTEVFRRKHLCDFFDSFNYSAGPHSLENQGFPNIGNHFDPDGIIRKWQEN